MDHETAPPRSKLNRHVEVLEAREFRCNVLQMSVGEAFNLSAIGAHRPNNHGLMPAPARTMK